ncbi:hypothetical protein MRB53_012476 [Persea americana]|uniref:Uncharacterized protein n=1 Tax=Persea americana TaxID=3435 RepID=A0ACC2LY02_PERAE|nr:hypothetical protein MRB53_012476 [Persea americana]
MAPTAAMLFISHHHNSTHVPSSAPPKTDLLSKATDGLFSCRCEWFSNIFRRPKTAPEPRGSEGLSSEERFQNALELNCWSM